MDYEKPDWCPKCSVRIAPYAPRTVHKGINYHQTCFVKLAREQASEVRRAFVARARIALNQYVRAR